MQLALSPIVDHIFLCYDKFKSEQKRKVTNMSVIKVHQLTKRYGAFTAVDHVSFRVETGSLLGFLGINGAGKTTLINMLSTLLTPDDGSAEICGYSLGRENQAIRRRIGIVYQQNCLDDLLTVKENLMCRGVLHGATPTETKARLDYLTERLKMNDLLKRKYRQLSGGQKRRCEIAAALMHTPDILFLDEPTTGLDPATRQDVWNAILTLRKEQNTTIFLTTHYMEEAAGADQVILLDRGRIVTQGKPCELKEKYAGDKLMLYYPSGQKEELPLSSTLDALPILAAKKGSYSSFEVIRGTMDDVFLHALGPEIYSAIRS